MCLDAAWLLSGSFLNTGAGCVQETGFRMQEWMQHFAESVQDTSAMDNANRRLFRELDDRYRGYSFPVLRSGTLSFM